MRIRQVEPAEIDVPDSSSSLFDAKLENAPGLLLTGALVNVSTLMVDVDGVLITRPDGRRWDWNLEADLGLSPDLLQQAFFAPYFHSIVVGKAGLEERLAFVLADIAPHLSARKLIDYWFERDSRLDEDLLGDLLAVRAAGMQVHLATVQEHLRAEHLWKKLGLSERFEAIHYAAALGFAKPDLEFFNAVERRTGLRGAEVLLIDDSAANVDSARAAGWRAALWDGRQRLRAVLAGEGLGIQF